MAGIGFELRRQLRRETYADILQRYVYAGIIGSGPWLVSIGSLVTIGSITQALGRDPTTAMQFFGAATWLISASLLLASGLALMFVRFVADRLFERRPELIVPNLLGILLITTFTVGGIGAVIAIGLFPGLGAVQILLPCTLVALADVWILAGLLSGSKAYGTVVGVFVLGYGVAILGAIVLARFGLAGLLMGFLAGHGFMAFTMLALVAREYPSQGRIAFDFFERKYVHPDLLWTGLLFHLAVWVDKYVFWFNPATSESVLGPIRFSIVYDIPISIAYLSIVPGMAAFLVRIETDFARCYDEFYASVREGGRLSEIRRLRAALVEAARNGIHDIMRIQGLTVAVLVLASERVLALFGLPSIYAFLLRVDLVATAFQLVLLGILTLLFYLDHRKVVLWICALFAFSNLVLSILTQMLGPRFFGMGFAVSAAIATLTGLRVLSSRLDQLDYETFMR